MSSSPSPSTSDRFCRGCLPEDIIIFFCKKLVCFSSDWCGWQVRGVLRPRRLVPVHRRPRHHLQHVPRVRRHRRVLPSGREVHRVPQADQQGAAEDRDHRRVPARLGHDARLLRRLAGPALLRDGRAGPRHRCAQLLRPQTPARPRRRGGHEEGLRRLPVRARRLQGLCRADGEGRRRRALRAGREGARHQARLGPHRRHHQLHQHVQSEVG